MHGEQSEVLIFTHKEIVSIRIGASNAEELHQVVKLPVNIPAYSYGAFL